jgi:hypothetical protein
MQLETVLDRTHQSNIGLQAELKTANEEIAMLRDQLKSPEPNAKVATENDSEQLAQLKADYAKDLAESQKKDQDIEELQTRYDQLDERFAAQI